MMSKTEYKQIKQMLQKCKLFSLSWWKDAWCIFNRQKYIGGSPLSPPPFKPTQWLTPSQHWQISTANVQIFLKTRARLRHWISLSVLSTCRQKPWLSVTLGFKDSIANLIPRNQSYCIFPVQQLNSTKSASQLFCKHLKEKRSRCWSLIWSGVIAGTITW